MTNPNSTISGAIIVTLGGSRLLNKGKTKSSIPATGWRRSARPSIRDITIIDEDKEDDPEEANEVEGRENRAVDVINEEEENGRSEEKVEYPATPSPKRNSITNINNNVC